MPGDTVATPDMTISATNVRVKFKDVIIQLSAGSTYHILKHKRVLAALVPADYAASTVDIEDETYNATNDRAMDALYEFMNPVTPETEIPASAEDIETVEDVAYNATNDAMDAQDLLDRTQILKAEFEADDYNKLDTLTMKELHSYAKTNDIEMPPRLRKSEVKAVIREALDKRGGHDYLDEEHDDEYDAFFADLDVLAVERNNRTV